MNLVVYMVEILLNAIASSIFCTCDSLRFSAEDDLHC